MDKAACTLLKNEKMQLLRFILPYQTCVRYRRILELNCQTSAPQSSRTGARRRIIRDHTLTFWLVLNYSSFLHIVAPLWSTLYRFFLFYYCLCLFLPVSLFFPIFTHDFAKFTRGKRKYALIVYNMKTAKTSRMEGAGCFWNANMLSLSIL